MLETGTIVAGYRIDSFLAQGGMGVVYRATQIALDRPVALKLIAPEFARDPAFRARFERESRLAASIEHPNVIPVYEAGEADEQLFIAMRFVPGTDLHAEIERSALEPSRAARIVAQVGDALDAAHRRGLVHRDVKPANVLIGESDHAYLTDFGLVKDLGGDGRMTSTGMWVGTPDYAAPEQFKGDEVDARTDIYALGCVLFHALTGEVPFPRSQAVAKMWAHTEEPPPALEGRLAVFNPVIERAMAKDPAGRFPSAGDLGRAGVAAAEGRAVSEGERTIARGEAAPTRPSDDAPTQVGGPPVAQLSNAPRRRVAIGLAAALTLLFAGGVAYIVLGGEDDEPGAAPTGATPDRPAASRTGPVVESKIRIGGQVRAVTAGSGFVYTMGQDGLVHQVDAERGKVLGDTQLEKFGGDVKFGLGSVWATSRATKEGAGELERIDPKTGIQSGNPVKVGKRPLGIATGRDVVFVTNASSSNVMRIDPAKMKAIGKPKKVEDGPFGITTRYDPKRGEVIWVTQFGDGTAKNRGGGVVRMGAVRPLDPAVDLIAFAPEEVGDNPQAVTYGGRYVWVQSGFGTVVRIDPETGEKLSTSVNGFSGFSGIIGDDNNVWIAGTSDGARRMLVAKLDLRSAKPIGKPADIGPGGGGRFADLALADGVLWASTGDTLYRLTP